MKKKPRKKLPTKPKAKNETRNSPQKRNQKSRPVSSRKTVKGSSAKRTGRTKQDKEPVKVVNRKVQSNPRRKSAKKISKRITRIASDSGKRKPSGSKAIVSTSKKLSKKELTKLSTKVRNTKTGTYFKGGGNPETLADRVLNNPVVDKRLKYQITKTGKEPKAMVVIVKVKSPEGTTKTFSVISQPDFIVNLKNARGFYKATVSDAQSIFEEFYGGDGDPDGFKVLESSIKFIY